MENIINFIQTYWGYTLFGSVTLGTLITFTIVLIKTILSNKGKDLSIIQLQKLVSTMKTEMEKKTEENNNLISNLQQYQISSNKKDEYMHQIVSTMFKSISFLVMASKLPSEDKEALEQDLQNLKLTSTEEFKVKLTQYDEHLTDAIKTGEDQIVEDVVKDVVVPDAIDTVQNTIEKTQTLFDKYLNKEENV